MRDRRAQILEELSLYLRPPGQGIYTVSTGKKELSEFSQQYCPYYQNSLTYLQAIN